ncbi:MAG: type 1 glutamine amidotransferase, partial [Opitutaceae bacterium]|nr:type 1 glutamine amidotransferase [Opitutaceae bacterium]
MRVHVYQHVPFEGIDGMAAWVERGGHALSRTRFYAGDKPPPPGAHDFLIIMGGPMGVHDTGRHPWLAEEKRAIAAAIGSGQAVLGVCLGAQLIADVLGARVAPNREKEIGWLDVSLEPV